MAEFLEISTSPRMYQMYSCMVGKWVVLQLEEKPYFLQPLWTSPDPRQEHQRSTSAASCTTPNPKFGDGPSPDNTSH